MNIDTTPREWPRHGGELSAAAERYGIPAADWLDLSTGINPQPWPVPRLSPLLYAALPDRAALGRLLDTARDAYQIPETVALAAVPGTELAIHLAPALMPPGPTAIFGPTYESYRQAWELAGGSVVMVDDAAELPPGANTAVIVNPNNPDGRTFAPQALAEMAATLSGRGGILLVDEAFADTRSNSSLCPMLDQVPALVLRSLGKFYGLPGLRLGFVAGPARFVDRLAGVLGDWPVSTAAIEIGTAALRDVEWRETTRKRLAADSHRLRGILMRHGFSIVGGTDLFILGDARQRAWRPSRALRAGDPHARVSPCADMAPRSACRRQAPSTASTAHSKRRRRVEPQTTSQGRITRPLSVSAR